MSKDKGGQKNKKVKKPKATTSQAKPSIKGDAPKEEPKPNKK